MIVSAAAKVAFKHGAPAVALWEGGHPDPLGGRRRAREPAGPS